MIYLDERGKELVLKDFSLKKFFTKFSKLLKKSYEDIKLFVDYEEGAKIPVLVFGIPSDMKVDNPENFFNSLGDLFDQSGNLEEVSQAFLMCLENLENIERKENA